jgi:hypothetical protein
MIDKVLRRSRKSSCLAAEPVGRERDPNPNSAARHRKTRPETMNSLFARSILSATAERLVEAMIVARV